MKKAEPCETEGHIVDNSNWERWFDNITTNFPESFSIPLKKTMITSKS